MRYFKLGCNWGKNKPDFFSVLMKHSIVICADYEMKKGDYVAIANGHNIKAVAQITADREQSTSRPELQEDFSKYGISYNKDNYVASAKIWELSEADKFKYKLQQGLREINQSKIRQKIKSLIDKFMEQKPFEEYTQLLRANYNLVLTGAPGTGKTYLAKQIAESIGAECELVQFHPSYDYTDFVEGLRPVEKDGKLGFERRDGVFKAFCKKAMKSAKQEVVAETTTSQTQPYVFIIDEINRGEISKIFGELFYAIDSGYRGEKGRINTQYQNLVPEDDPFSEGFYIPENVYIIGTMNDIDRSVECMDFAMRRRFAWKEITVESRQSMLDDPQAWEQKPEQEVIAEIKARMNNLNACIVDEYNSGDEPSKDRIGLTKAYQIGASYFLKYGLYNNFDALWDNHIKGLLYEYLRGTSNIEDKIAKLKEAYQDANP